MRVLVAEGNGAARAALCDALSGQGLAVCDAADGRRALAVTNDLRPDALVLSLELPVWDGLFVLEKLAARQLPHYPHIVAVSAMGDEPLARARQLGADATLPRPFEPGALIALLARLPGEGPSGLTRAHARARLPLARRQLREIGVPERLKGFGYLARAVALVSADDRALGRATGFLYPYLAAEAGESDHSVERAMRHAIETTWTRGSVAALHRVFGNSVDPQRGKPTNTECLAMLAQRLCESMAAENAAGEG